MRALRQPNKPLRDGRIYELRKNFPGSEPFAKKPLRVLRQEHAVIDGPDTTPESGWVVTAPEGSIFLSEERNAKQLANIDGFFKDLGKFDFPEALRELREITLHHGFQGRAALR